MLFGGESWSEEKALEAFLRCLYYGKHSGSARSQAGEAFDEVWLQSSSEALCTLPYLESTSAATDFPFKGGTSSCKLSCILIVGVFIKKVWTTKDRSMEGFGLRLCLVAFQDISVVLLLLWSRREFLV